MVKHVYKLLIGVAVVCLVVFFTLSVLNVFSQEVFDEKEIESSVKDFSEEIFDEKEIEISAKDFPLGVDLQKTVFNVGDVISCNITITNKCGKDVYVAYNGFMPTWFLHEVNDTSPPALPLMFAAKILKANDEMTAVVNQTIVKPPGTYILDVFYELKVDGVEIRDKLETIIEVK